MPAPTDCPLFVDSEIYGTIPFDLFKDLPGEFLLSEEMEAGFIARAAYDGFLPMAETWGGAPCLALKLHHERCVLDPSSLGVGKSLKKTAQGYELTVGRDPRGVMEGVWNQHGLYWFTPELFRAVEPLWARPQHSVSYCSVELWKGERLTAGDLGLISGQRYLSLTGFYTLSGSGSVLLASLGKLLALSGFKMWDLGMDMPYKRKMGAGLLPRRDFLDEITRLREKPCTWIPGPYPCRDLLLR